MNTETVIIATTATQPKKKSFKVADKHYKAMFLSFWLLQKLKADGVVADYDQLYETMHYFDTNEGICTFYNSLEEETSKLSEAFKLFQKQHKDAKHVPSKRRQVVVHTHDDVAAV
ncbi:MAG: hypothetical protein EBR81_15275, partial [Proteobacteria bacterium]|nr:hypothetical protein [Pseudomonadota bacterium]